jgi:predicted phosphatase
MPTSEKTSPLQPRRSLHPRDHPAIVRVFETAEVVRKSEIPEKYPTTYEKIAYSKFSLKLCQESGYIYAAAGWKDTIFALQQLLAFEISHPQEV